MFVQCIFYRVIIKFYSSCVMFPFLSLKTKWLKISCLIVEILRERLYSLCCKHIFGVQQDVFNSSFLFRAKFRLRARKWNGRTKIEFRAQIVIIIFSELRFRKTQASICSTRTESGQDSSRWLRYLAIGGRMAR